MGLFGRNGTTTRDEQLDLSVELLENRRMLAGNIRVLTNAAGDLTLRGDGRNNHVEVSQDVSGDIIVTGLKDIQGLDTGLRVGREFFDEVTIDADDFSGKLTMILRGGHDFAVLRNVTLDGDFTFKSGGGSDSLGFFESTANANATFITGGGNDYLNFVGATFDGSFNAKTGGGVDFFGLSDFAVSTGRTASFVTGGGGDIIYIEDSVVDGNISAVMGSSIDTIYVADGTTLNGNVDVDMGSLFDLLAIENVVTFNELGLNVNGGRGGFGYSNKLFIDINSPLLNNIPDGLIGFEADVYTISGTATTAPTIPETLTKWVVDDYYNQSPDVNFDVVETLVAANLARGFDYNDLPRNDNATAPDPAYLGTQITAILNSSNYYGYQKIFVRSAFQNEISVFDWNSYDS